MPAHGRRAKVGFSEANKHGLRGFGKPGIYLDASIA